MVYAHLVVGLDFEQRDEFDTKLRADPDWDRRASRAIGMLIGERG